MWTSSLNVRQMPEVFEKSCDRLCEVASRSENAASVIRVTELDGECSNSCLAVQQRPSEPAIRITSVQKSAGCRADLSALSCSAGAIKGIPGILHWARLRNGCSPWSPVLSLILLAINFIKVCWITEAIFLSDAIRTIRQSLYVLRTFQR